MPDLHTINISSCGKLVLHSKLFEVRVGAAEEAGHSLKDVTVTGRLYLAEVSMDTVQPLAFHLRRAREFSVFASKFERISMHGIKLGECKEFNVLGMTHFSSLAAHAIKVKCDKFS